ncbi:hypothetical protein BDV12DRAFT_210268 [Aspergillus spectabilis]
MANEYISQKGLSALMWIGIILSIIFVAIRTRVQYTHAHKFYINDYWIFFAIIAHIATATVYQIAIPPMYEVQYFDYATGVMDSAFMDRASLFLRLQFAVDFLLWSTLWAVKFSLLFFFWRLFDSVRTPLRAFWIAMVAATGASWVTLVVLQNLACDPIKNFFTLGKCSSARDLYYSNLVFRFTVGTDITGDILIMIIPFPLLQHLQVAPRKKLLLTAIFSLPLIPIIFAILRLVIANPHNENVDPIKFQLYSMLENSSAIVTSCLPSFRLFVVNSRVVAGSGRWSGSAGGMMYKYNYRAGNGDYFRNGGVGVGSKAEVRVGEQAFGMESVDRGRGRGREMRGREVDEDKVYEEGDTRTEESRESQRGTVGGQKGVVVTREFSVR